MELMSKAAGLILPRSRPGRILAAGTCVDALGTGMFFASSALYFVGVVGIPADRVAYAVTLSGALAMLAPVPMGRLADRFGPAPFYILLLLLRGAGYSCYAGVSDYPAYLVLTVLLTALDRSCSPIQQAVVVTVIGGPDRTRSMASIRAVRNIGLTAGFLLSGVVFAAANRTLFTALFLGNGVSFVIVALMVRRAVTMAGASVTIRQVRLAGQRRQEPDGPPVRSPFRDRWFMLLAAGNVVLSLYDTMLIVLLPVWILRNTQIDPAWVPVVMAVNTVLTAVLQVHVSRFAHGPAAALRLLVTAGLLMCACCGLFALTESLDGTAAAVPALVAAVVVLSLAENLNSVAVWELSTELSPATARARYLGAFSLSQAGQKVLGPTLLVVALLPLGIAAWPILTGAFAGATVLSRTAVRRGVAERSTGPSVDATLPTATLR